MIRTTYDPEADIAQVSFGTTDAVYDGSEEVSPGIMLHVDTEGRVIGIEIEIEAVSVRMAGTYKIARKPAAAE